MNSMSSAEKKTYVASSWVERIDRKVFLDFWNNGSIREKAFARVLYRDSYPHWPEMKSDYRRADHQHGRD
jgi:hypothetical protein